MSDMTKNPLLLAGGGALAGLVVGMLLSNAVTDRKIADGIQSAMAEVEQTQAEARAASAAAVSEQIAAIETVLADSRAEMSGLTDALAARIDAGSDALSAEIDARFASVSSDIRAAARGQSAALALFSSRPGPAPVAVQDATEPAPAAVAEAAPEGHGVGETSVFADGNVRVFVSRLDAAESMARLSLNGEDIKMSAGEAKVVRHRGGTCIVGLSAVGASGAMITSDCDTPLAEPRLSVGETVSVADGALRVFLSGVVNGDARLAINGLETRVIGVGEVLSVPAGDQSCAISLQGIRDGAVGLNASCS